MIPSTRGTEDRLFGTKDLPLLEVVLDVAMPSPIKLVQQYTHQPRARGLVEILLLTIGSIFKYEFGVSCWRYDPISMTTILNLWKFLNGTVDSEEKIIHFPKTHIFLQQKAELEKERIVFQPFFRGYVFLGSGNPFNASQQRISCRWH